MTWSTQTGNKSTWEALPGKQRETLRRCSWVQSLSFLQWPSKFFFADCRVQILRCFICSPETMWWASTDWGVLHCLWRCGYVGHYVASGAGLDSFLAPQIGIIHVEIPLKWGDEHHSTQNPKVLAKPVAMTSWRNLSIWCKPHPGGSLWTSQRHYARFGWWAGACGHLKVAKIQVLVQMKWSSVRFLVICGDFLVMDIVLSFCVVPRRHGMASAQVSWFVGPEHHAAPEMETWRR